MAEAKRSVLVVANRTAESDELVAALQERAKAGPVGFHLLVPSTSHGVSWAADMHSGEHAAEHDLDGALESLRALGLDVDGEVGDPDPIAAVHDATRSRSYDEVIVSTLPKHLSKWLKLDLPRRVSHATGLPVRHVEATHVKAHA